LICSIATITFVDAGGGREVWVNGFLGGHGSFSNSSKYSVLSVLHVVDLGEIGLGATTEAPLKFLSSTKGFLPLVCAQKALRSTAGQS
jgi:hypothetical protein